MTLDPRTPVIVGVGQFLHRADGLDDALEPVALMEQAVLAAASDAGLDGPPAADSIRVVSAACSPSRRAISAAEARSKKPGAA